MDKIWRWLLFTVKVLVTMFIASFLCAMIFAVVYTWMDFSWGWHLNLLSDTSVEEVWGLAILVWDDNHCNSYIVINHRIRKINA